MKVNLNAKLYTSDGESAGNISRAIVDPHTNEVTDFVVTTGMLLGRDVLIPRSEFEMAVEGGDEVRLRMTKAELDSMRTYEEQEFKRPPDDWIAPSSYATDFNFEYDAYLFPANESMLNYQQEYKQNDLHLEQISISKGASVVDGRGEKIGVVDEIEFDPKYGQLQSFVLRVGSGVETFFGGGESLDVLRDQINYVEDGVVYLCLSKDRLKEHVERAA